MTDNEKTTQLLNLMDALCNPNFAKDNSKMDEWIRILNKVYANEYRHTYSDFLLHIQKIVSSEKSPEALDVLGENLNILAGRIDELSILYNEDANYKNTAFGFKKFSDHIRLEIGRYNFIRSEFLKPQTSNPSPASDSMSQEAEQRMQALEKSIDDMRPTVTKAQKTNEWTEKQLSGVDEKLESNKISSITTLTIFSAVILAFSGGITFESGIFKGMAESSPYRLVFTTALTGFILFNTIFALLYLVGKLAGKRISTNCKYLSFDKNESAQIKKCGDGYCTKECSEVNIACRMSHKYTYVCVVNGVLLYILYSDFFMWLSKGKISSLTFGLSQGVLAALILIIVTVRFICRKVRFRRIVLHYKVEIIQGIIEPEESPPAIFAFSEALAKAFGASSKNKLPDMFLEYVEGQKGKEALQHLDHFINEHLLDDDRLAISVSAHEHRINKYKWKNLEQRFNDWDC